MTLAQGLLLIHFTIQALVFLIHFTIQALALLILECDSVAFVFILFPFISVDVVFLELSSCHSGTCWPSYLACVS